MRVGVPGNRPLGRPRILLFRHVGSRATRWQALQPLLDVWARHPLHSKRPLRYNPTITEPPTGSTTARTMARSNPVTRLLLDWSNGNPTALDELTPHVYSELHVIARRHLSRGSPNRTLQPTALINEVYLRLIEQTRPIEWEGRTHFFGIASRLMRNILVDYCRVRHAAKRGGAAIAVTLTETVALASGRLPDVLELDEALNCLAKRDERKAKVIELRYFGGLTREEIAVALNLTIPTVKRDLRLGEAWLRCHLAAGG